MHPEAREAASGRFGLGPFVLVVREDQVGTASVDVEPVAEKSQRHGHALDVPARPSRHPGRVPGGLAGLGGFPEREVQRVALAIVHRHAGAGAGAEFLRVAMGEASVVGILRHVEVDTGTVDHVRSASRQQFLHERHHLGDVRRRPWPLVGILDAERADLADVDIGEAGRHLLFGASLGCGPFDDPVVDVGDVADHPHPEATPHQIAPQHVVGEGSPGVPQVGHVVNRRPADVDRDLSRRART